MTYSEYKNILPNQEFLSDDVPQQQEKQFITNCRKWMCFLLSDSTPRTDVIQLAIFALRAFEYKSSYSTDTVNEEESKGIGILNEFKK